jgi:hypothetical protein
VNNNFLDNENLNSIAEKIYKTNKNSTLWDLVANAIAESANIKPYIIWILSDFPIIEAVARGYGLDYIRDSLEVKRQDIVSTCRVWGLFYWTETLDFSPLASYNSSMTAEEYKESLRPVLATMPYDDVIEHAISNVEKYRSIKELLDEWENEK